MTDVNIANYFTAKNNLITACHNTLTTLIELQTLTQAYQTAINECELNVNDANFSLSMVLYLIDVNSKSEIQSNFYNLVKIRDQFVNIYSETHTTIEILNYVDETQQIRSFIENTLIAGCVCMSSRCNIIANI